MNRIPTRDRKGADVATAPYESRVRQVGREIFERARAAEPRFWQQAYWFDRATGLAMRDERLKVQAFRWVDALPAMRTDGDIAAHLKDYLDPQQVKLPAPAKLALSFDDADSWYARALGSTARRAAYAAAGRFITGSNPQEAIAAVERMRRQGMAFTLDVLGEATISERRADSYAQAYIGLIETLGPVARSWPEVPRIDRDAHGPMPRVNVSIKLTCLDTHFDPIDPVRARKRVSARLRPILRAAQKHGAFVNIDVESFAVRDLTFELFKTLLNEPEFRDWPDVGIVVQAYLKDAENDLNGLLEWVEQRRTPIGIRLVKGAYWDHETVLAEQNNTPIPVWTRKWESDACYEKLTRVMLDNHDKIRPAFASHNVRSLAHVMACAEHLGLGPADYEIQMLHGMGDPLKTAIRDMDRCLRIYCPYGELIPGMAYLIRRLLENTSNDSFLRQGFRERRSQERLLADPNVTRPPSTRPPVRRYVDTDPEDEMTSFRNVPATSFGRADNRERMRSAIAYVRGELGQHHPLVINGVNVVTPETFDSVNPSRPSELVGRVARASVEHADQAVAAANKTFEHWRRTSAKRRAQLLRKAADLMQERRFELSAWLILEAGKPWREADADVAEGIDYVRYYADRVELMETRPRRRDLPGEDNVLVYAPRGVCAVLSPFNFPIAILAGMTSAALATGNTVVFKPSSAAAVTGAKLMGIYEAAGFPRGVVNYLPGPGSVIGSHLVQHPDVHLIAFTGSRAVGLHLVESAAVVRGRQRHLKRVIADLGGKNATIVDGDAELDEAVMGVQASAFAYAGQRCSACSRAIVLADVYDDFCAKLVESTATLVVGPAEEPGTEVGPVIDPAALESVRQYIESGRREGRVLYEADLSHLAGGGYYVGPTIIADLDPHARIAQEEIFGPVLTILKAATFEEAIKIANDTPYALTGGVYSRSPDHLRIARGEFNVGNLYINRKITGSRADVQPFGGFKLSGTGNGKAGGPDYLLQFCQARNITENALRHGFAPVQEKPSEASA